ncbi:hypothetical protein HTT03_02230 [Sulfitobacter sp. S0837]|uniref:hypothetical protein n=1 Tax=Sulfitobacter maritimus TaxID=2741719 RepID=UPI00158266B5|nr:hypothetical protein [Sulfitobacter maritimus]NUH64120.1 hypothetical protein [Sulfitobacter maritimus]
MTSKILLGVSLSAALLSTAASAQDNIATGFDPVLETAPMGWSAGVSSSVDIDPDRFHHLDHEVEAYVEMSFGGFHSGFSATSIHDDPVNDVELELDLGYGEDFGQDMSWDLSYSYAWLDGSKDHSEEITGTLGFPIGRDVTGAVAVILDPDTGDSDQEFAFAAPLTEQWSLVGLVGNSDRDDNLYAEAGVVYDMGNGMAFEAIYEDTNDSDGVLGLTVSYEIGN